MDSLCIQEFHLNRGSILYTEKKGEETTVNVELDLASLPKLPLEYVARLAFALSSTFLVHFAFSSLFSLSARPFLMLFPCPMLA